MKFVNYDIDIVVSAYPNIIVNIPGPFNPEINRVDMHIDKIRGFTLKDIEVENIQNYPDWLFEPKLRDFYEQYILKTFNK